MRVEGVVLEDHGDISVLGGDVVDFTIIDVDGAGGNFLEAGDHTKRGAFAAPRGTHENHKFSVTDFDIYVVYRRLPWATFFPWIGFEEIFDFDGSHYRSF
jgi:hypothetical protein